MVRVLITGSSDGIGLSAAKTLIKRGHSVILHARSSERAEQTRKAAPGAEAVLIGDLSTLAGIKTLAADANQLGEPFDAVVHNAAMGHRSGYEKTCDGYSAVFTVNTLAPYVLTAMMRPPKQLLYLSSSLHASGDASLKDLGWESGRPWSGFQAYSDSKLHNVMLAYFVARKWHGVQSNAIDPGWVRTKMGGTSAPGPVENGADTIVWLLEEGERCGSGKLFQRRRAIQPHAGASDVTKQEELLQLCARMSGVQFPIA